MNITRTQLSFFLVLCSYLLSGSAAAESWLRHPKWDEGLAEIGLYEGKLLKYGALRDAMVDLITVREYFHPDRKVKTPSATTGNRDSVPVMKQNLTRRIRTGIYEYIQAGSTFVHRDTGRLVKISAVSTEWCGNSSATITCVGSEYELRIANYMDNEGLSLDSVSTSSDVLFYDQLLLHLRGNADSLQPGRAFRLVDSMVSNNPAYRERAASITSIEHFPGDGITTPLIIITVRVGNDTETFHLADDPLRHLVRWENDRGEHLSLRKRLFLDYWNRSRPGDEQWLE